MRNSLFQKYMLIFVLTLMVSACNTSSGFKNPWKIDRSSATSANQAPSTLSGPNTEFETTYQSPYRGNIGLEGADQAQGSYPPHMTQVENEQTLYLGQGAMSTSLGLPPSPPASVRVALLVPMSGKAGHIGKALFNAAQLALFDLKMQDYQIVPYDTGSTPEGAKRAAEQAIGEGASLILGPLFADSVRQVRQVAARINISVIGFSTDWTTASSNSYVMGFMPFTQIQRVVAFAASQGYRNIGVIVPDDLYGEAVLNTYLEEAQLYGLTTVDILKFKKGMRDISLEMRAFARYDERRDEEGELLEEYELPFDAVLMAVGGEQAIAISNLLTFNDLDPRRVKRIGTGLFDDTALIGEDNLNGAWFAAPSPDLRQSFTSRYRTLFGDQPPRLASLAYDSTALSIVLARHGMKQNGVPSYSRSHLTNPNGYSGIDGIFRFHQNGLIERGLAILQLDRGRIRVIDPAPSSFVRPNL